jgi:glycosyltransferase involved in cell wall biosynthesis
MKKGHIQDIKLVFTAALKKEVPADWLASQMIPVYTIKSLRSGALCQQASSQKGILFIITGTGLRASKEAACWIRDNLNPLYVLNIGTCGLIDRTFPLGTWIQPHGVADEEGQKLEIDRRLPIQHPEDMIGLHSLLSVREARLDTLPDPWKEHNAVDMECFAQARGFRDTPISFHCLKFSADYSDRNILSDFERNLGSFREELKTLLGFAKKREQRAGISVIIPVYNRQHTIQRAIDSVLSQSYKPEEIIVVNDGSTDRTGEILKDYHDAITCVSLSENSGPSKARNAGLSHARSEWIAFLDSDDCWERDKLKNQVEYLRKYPFYQIMQSEEVWIRRGVRVNPRKHHAKPEGWIWEQSLERCLVSPSSILAKKSLLNQYGNFDEGLPVCEDYDLWLKISRNHPVGLDSLSSVTKYGGHNDQLSQKYPAMDRFRVFSLMRMLEHEPLRPFRMKIIPVLESKLNILIQGYEKRKNLKDSQECRTMLESLAHYR